MFSVVLSNQFKRDIKKAASRNYNLDLLKEVVNKLAAGEQLDDNNYDHNLSGNYDGFRECHIKPDWLLIYRIEKSDLILFLFRTGTHSDLF